MKTFTTILKEAGSARKTTMARIFTNMPTRYNNDFDEERKKKYIKKNKKESYKKGSKFVYVFADGSKVTTFNDYN